MLNTQNISCELLYNSADYLSFLKYFFKYHPCFLCGKIHEFHNHGQVLRLIRDNQTYANTAIIIFVAYCADSKAIGKPYTKRILPPFLIPECNITLENCIRMAKEDRDLTIDRACELLGTFCERTVRRHSRQMNQVLQQTISWAMTWLAEFPLIGCLPGNQPGKTLYEDLLEMYQTLLSAGENLNGFYTEPPAIIRLPAYILALTKTRTPCSVPLNLVCLMKTFFDTS